MGFRGSGFRVWGIGCLGFSGLGVEKFRAWAAYLLDNKSLQPLLPPIRLLSPLCQGFAKLIGNLRVSCLQEDNQCELANREEGDKKNGSSYVAGH